MAVLSIAVGISVLLVSFAILGGFKEKIRDKVFGFDSHIQITHYQDGHSVNAIPISLTRPFYNELQEMPEVKRVNAYARKVGIIQYSGEVEGVSLKGVSHDYDTIAFADHLKKGRFIDFEQESEVIISRTMSEQLMVDTGDTILFNIFQGGKPRHRLLQVVGIYSTGLEDIDERSVLGNLKLVQGLNNWDDTQVEGYELVVHDPRKLDQIFDDVFDAMDMDLAAQKITDKYYSIFDWLLIISGNVNFLIVMVFVIVFINLIAIMFILIMERTQMIGLLKALGARNILVRRIFWHTGLMLLVKGLLFGNGFAFLFCFLQDHFSLIPLNEESYYMDAVPIQWDMPAFILINVVAVVVISFIILIPTTIVANIKPIKAIKFA